MKLSSKLRKNIKKWILMARQKGVKVVFGFTLEKAKELGDECSGLIGLVFDVKGLGRAIEQFDKGDIIIVDEYLLPLDKNKIEEMLKNEG